MLKSQQLLLQHSLWRTMQKVYKNLYQWRLRAKKLDITHQEPNLIIWKQFKVHKLVLKQKCTHVYQYSFIWKLFIIYHLRNYPLPGICFSRNNWQRLVKYLIRFKCILSLKRIRKLDSKHTDFRTKTHVFPVYCVILNGVN